MLPSCPAYGIIPTPCSVKRPMDEELIHRFHKRLRLNSNCGSGVQDSVTPSVAAAVAEVSRMQLGVDDAYAQVNSLLRGLHSQSQARRQSISSQGNSGGGDMDSSSSGNSCELMAPNLQRAFTCSGRLDLQGMGPPMMTNFCMMDVVCCDHGPNGRCLHCSGRVVENVPLAIHSAWSRAYSALTASSSSASSSMLASAQIAEPSHSSIELSFPAFVALAASLAPEPGEQLLHLGSGAGRAVLAWTLLLPDSSACGVESSFGQHRAAVAATAQLDANVQSRIYLHHGDIFAVQGDWHQASVIIISAASFDDCTAARLAEGLRGCHAGTRVISLSRPLGVSAPLGFVLARQAAYRMAGGGNATAFIYRKT
mmetsp:Transcript_158293/g.303753  ORF Transcript_158293/g.303753 Transcript_158293/m.303753 type:complete len:368 (-) Transcript_158293:62-1165(-)